MTTFPGAARTDRCGLVTIDPATAAVLRVIAMQYNPETLTRSLQVQAIADSADHSEALRLKGPPVETIKFDAELDATDQLEFPEQNAAAVESGIHAQLAALEMLVYPTSEQLQTNNNLAKQGTLEILPMQSPLLLFVCSRFRILPVRITELSITEEAFNAKLSPIRARVSLGLRVLSVTDLGFDQKGGSLSLMAVKEKERFAAAAATAMTGVLGISGVR